MPTDLRPQLAADLDGSFEELVRRHQDGVYTAALRMSGGCRVDAEEIAQEAFVRAYRALRGYDAERIRVLQVRPWLAQITLNLCRNAARARSRRPPTSPLSNGAEPVAADSTDRIGWDGLLAGLPDRQRAAVVLRHVQGLPYAEIAIALDLPVGTVKSDVHRALATLAAAGKEDR